MSGKMATRAVVAGIVAGICAGAWAQTQTIVQAQAPTQVVVQAQAPTQAVMHLQWSSNQAVMQAQSGTQTVAQAEATAPAAATQAMEQVTTVAVPPPVLALPQGAVLADRVNMRAKPSADAEVVAQVYKGDVVKVRQVAGDWVEIVPPTNVSVWVFAEFVKDGTVMARKLNMRGGPGINYRIVGVLETGSKVTVRMQRGEWLEVAAPESASLWVSREFIKVPESVPSTNAAPSAAAEVKAPASGSAVIVPPPAAQVKTETLVAPVAKPVMPPPVAEQGLVPLEGQGKVIEAEGVLRQSGFFNLRRLSDFCLVDNQRGRPVTVCYVKGNNAQLTTFVGRRIRIQGREYWLKGGGQYVLIPDQIMPLPDKP